VSVPQSFHDRWERQQPVLRPGKACDESRRTTGDGPDAATDKSDHASCIRKKTRHGSRSKIRNVPCAPPAQLFKVLSTVSAVNPSRRRFLGTATTNGPRRTKRSRMFTGWISICPSTASNIEKSSGPKSGLLANLLRDDEPSGRIHGNSHGTD